MKLRLEKGVIKIRLKPEEIEELKNENFLSEELYIKDENRFGYSVKVSEDTDICLIKFDKSGLLVIVPEEKVNNWMNSNQIGIKETIITDKGEYIVLTLEEDLPPRKFKKDK